MPGIASSAHFDRSQPRKPSGSSMTYVPIPPQDGQGDDEEAAGLSGNSEEEVQEPSQGEQPSPEEQPPSPADATAATHTAQRQGELPRGQLGCCLGVTVD